MVIPDGMYQKNSGVDNNFFPDEYLFRRVSPQAISGKNINLEALDFPDMSVGRSKYGHPEWLRLYNHNGVDCATWAVVGFRIEQIPTPHLVDNIQYVFIPAHDPERKNYPHTVIRTHNGNVTITSLIYFPHRLSLDWRARLKKFLTIFIEPNVGVEIRQDRPKDHHPTSPTIL